MCREVVAALSNEPKDENKTKAEERQPPTRDGRERRRLACRCLEEEKDEICQEEEVGVYYCNLSYSVYPVVNYYTAGRHA